MTWRQLLEYCCGEVGLKPSEFWSMTFSELEIYCKGYEMREAKRKMLPRLIATRLLNMFRAEGSRAIEMTDVMPLYTDNNKTGKEDISITEADKKWKERAKWQTRN